MANAYSFAFAVTLVILVCLVIMLFLGVAGRLESFQPVYQGASWATTSSSNPVGYGNRATRHSDSVNIRRWRTPVPVGPGARQVQDDTWARTYASGPGFQLG